MNKFTKEFKQKAIKLKKGGIHPNKIFEDAKLDISGKQKDYATKLINKWGGNNKIKSSKFTKEELSKLKKVKKEEEIKKIEYLKAQVAYLQAENDFLAKLPKKK